MPRTVYTSEATITRPANVDAYVIKDAIGAAVLTFSKVVPYEAWSGLVVGCRMTDSSIVATALDAELTLWTVAPTVPADGSVFAPTDAELAYYVGTVDLPGSGRFDHSVNTVYSVDGKTIAFKTAGTSRDLIGVLVARNAYVPTSGEIFRIELHVVADT